MRLIPATVLLAGMMLTVSSRAAPITAVAPIHASAAATVKLPTTLAITPFKMRYRVLRDGWHLGNATFTLQPAANGTWLFQSHASASGLAALFIHATFGERSHFMLHDQRLQPLSYAYTDSGNPTRNETIRFNWTTRQALDTKDGKTIRIALAPGILDRLTVQLALSRRLAAGLPLPATWEVINGGELKRYYLKRKGKDVIATAAGDFNAVIVTREALRSKRTTTFWFAPQYEWLPVKIRQREPGKATITFVLSKLTWLRK